MALSIFLSHASNDKPFVRKLAVDLENQGIRCWIDEAEIEVGESLLEKISTGLGEVDYVVAILSPASVSSIWVQRELDMALNQEIRGRRVRVLPVLYQQCELPPFLLGKRYADFTDVSLYPTSFKDLVESTGQVFNGSALIGAPKGESLSGSVASAVRHNLRILSRPFHRPFQYIWMSPPDVAQEIGTEPNEAGNIVVENDDCRMYLESEGASIVFVQVDLKKTAPSYQHQEFDPLPMLGALSISPSELDFVRKSTYCHTWYHHGRKLKVDVMCEYDGGPISVSFGTKYYGS